MKLIVVDVGNTSTAVGLWSDGRVSHVAHCDGGFAEASRVVESLARLPHSSTHPLILAYVSVVPKVDRAWRAFAKARGLAFRQVTYKYFLGNGERIPRAKRAAQAVARGVGTYPPSEASRRRRCPSRGGNGLSIDYPKPETIGADRLADAAGAVSRYGAPVLVMDFGGGTLDVCVVETDICGQDPDVVGIAGDASLGGRDFDLMLIEHLESVYKDRGLDYSSLSSWERFSLDRRIRDVKRIFSENFSSTGSGTQMTIPLKWPGKGEVPLLLSKEVFRNLVTSKGISDRIRKCIRDAIADSGRSAKQITRAILTGGSSRWFFVRDIVREECGLSDNDETIIVSPTPFTDVAIGCAMSKARSGAAAEREGLWVKWRVNGEVAWHGPKNLLRPGRQNADVEIRHQHLCEIPSSRSLHPIRIELSFHWGDEESQPTPYLEGKSAVVDFHARSNHPLLKRPRDVINAMRGRTDRIETAFRDVYQCFLHCKEYPNGGPVFKLEIRDWEASKGILEAFDWNNPKLIDVTPGKFSRRGWFGIGTRKELAVEAIGEIKSTDGRESPSWKSKIKSLVSRIHRK